MSAGFSKGPWTLGKIVDGYREIDAKNANYSWTGLAQVVVQMEDFDIEHDCETLVDHDEGIANARLIAAAPELYEALEAARETLGFYLRELGSDYIRNTLLKVDAALRKARGES